MTVQTTRRGAATLLLLLALALVGGAAQAQPARLPLGAAQVKLPPGFELRLFASNVQTARFLTYSPQGDLYVGQLIGPNSAITRLADRNHDGSADGAVAVASGLYSPNNVTFRAAGFGSVFAVGPFSSVGVYTDTAGNGMFSQAATLIGGLPADGRHKTKTVAYGPDGQLYVSVGSFADDPPEADGRAGIWRYNPDGSGGKRIIGGLRNTVGFGWDAVTGALWGADNGSDDLGDNLPHDEFNQLVEGNNYGWPYCYDNRVKNSKTNAYDCSKTVAPAVLLAPRAGALGVAFYTGDSFPARYWGGAFVAYHSASYPGPRGVYYIPFKDGKPSGAPELFLQRVDGELTNRFVGLAVNPYDGSLMVSDDREGTIYQVRYTGPPPAAAAPRPAPTALPGKAAPQPAAPLLGFSRPFPQTGYTLHGAFLQFWFWNGGLARYGYPISGPLQEQSEDGKTYLVQYTERARLEYHPDNRGNEYVVLLGRLGADLVAGRSEAAFTRTTAQAGGTFVSQTGHNLSGDLLRYWQANGGVPVFGYPLSEPFQERNPADGHDYLVQYFERARLEYHPEHAGTADVVQLGLLGVQRYTARYGPPVVPAAP